MPYTVRPVKGPKPDSPFGRFGWEIVRPDGTVAATVNSKQGALDEAARINAQMEN